MISLHDQPKLTLEKFKQVRKDYDNGYITEAEFEKIIDEMNLAGGYDALGD